MDRKIISNENCPNIGMELIEGVTQKTKNFKGCDFKKKYYMGDL